MTLLASVYPIVRPAAFVLGLASCTTPFSAPTADSGIAPDGGPTACSASFCDTFEGRARDQAKGSWDSIEVSDDKFALYIDTSNGYNSPASLFVGTTGAITPRAGNEFTGGMLWYSAKGSQEITIELALKIDAFGARPPTSIEELKDSPRGASLIGVGFDNQDGVEERAVYVSAFSPNLVFLTVHDEQGTVLEVHRLSADGESLFVTGNWQTFRLTLSGIGDPGARATATVGGREVLNAELAPLPLVDVESYVGIGLVAMGTSGQSWGAHFDDVMLTFR